MLDFDLTPLKQLLMQASGIFAPFLPPDSCPSVLLTA